MRKSLIVVFFILALTSCKHKDVPNGILKKDEMQSVLWDVVRAEAFTNNFVKKDTLKNPVIEDAKLQQQIFFMHHITREDFYKSYSYYKEHSELLLPILDSITSKSNRDRNKVAKTKADSLNLYD